MWRRPSGERGQSKLELCLKVTATSWRIPRYLVQATAPPSQRRLKSDGQPNHAALLPAWATADWNQPRVSHILSPQSCNPLGFNLTGPEFTDRANFWAIIKAPGPELACAQKGLGHQEFSSNSGQYAKSFRGGRRDCCRQSSYEELKSRTYKNETWMCYVRAPLLSWGWDTIASTT